jgi:hypothetical protein
MNHRFEIVATLAALLCAASFVTAQGITSGPQPDETLPGSFQALNINGPFAGRYHSLVTEFRLKPVAMVFVRAQPEGVDPEVKKLLQTLDTLAEERNAESGLESCAIFLSPLVRNIAIEGSKANPKALVGETVNSERFISTLKELSKPFKRLIVASCSPDPVAKQYRLADRAEVTVIVYAEHRVFSGFGFAESQLKQEGIDGVVKGVEAMLDRLKKGPAVGK